MLHTHKLSRLRLDPHAIQGYTSNGLGIATTNTDFKVDANEYTIRIGVVPESRHILIDSFPVTVRADTIPLASVSPWLIDDIKFDVLGHETVDVMGELFIVHDDAELGKLLVHPPWSLMGAGPTVEAARKHLIEEALDLARAIGLDDPKDLTADANEMRNYALRIAARR